MAQAGGSQVVIEEYLIKKTSVQEQKIGDFLCNMILWVQYIDCYKAFWKSCLYLLQKCFGANRKLYIKREV